MSNDLIEKDDNRNIISDKIIRKLKLLIKDENAQFIGEHIDDNTYAYMINFNKGITFIKVSFILKDGDPFLIDIEGLK